MKWFKFCIKLYLIYINKTLLVKEIKIFIYIYTRILQVILQYNCYFKNTIINSYGGFDCNTSCQYNSN